MPTLQMLDVAIGIIFIFLLLSLICSAANEVIESILKKRASDLYRGIKELLLGGDERSDDHENIKILENLYRHPLISGLFKGKFNSKSQHNLPSYIPSRNFALALLDSILPATAAKLSGASGGSSNAAAVEEIAPTALDKPGDETPKQNIPGDDPAHIKEHSPISSDTETSKDSTARNIPINPLGGLREAVLKLPETNGKQALLTLIDAAGNDMNKVRENIEIWYNSSMDRVSGWYKRRVHWILIVLGLAISIAMNADTIAIFKSLMKDAPLRNSLVEAGKEYAKENPSVNANQKSPQDRVEDNVKRLNELRLPIGWDWEIKKAKKDSIQVNDLSQVKPITNAELAIPPPEFFPWVFKILGWVITALAISQGAPFWFDLLNKFMVIRSTVKPREKSPEESSEDSQK